MRTSSERILTTHTGALHRTAVAEIVRRQAELGIDVVDDGEFSKLSFWSYAKQRLGGVETRLAVTAAGRANERFHRRAGASASSASDRERCAEFYADTEPAGGVTTPPSLVQLYIPLGMAFEPAASHAVVGPLTYNSTEALRDIDNLKAALQQGLAVEEAFLPVVAPGMLASRYTNEYYRTDEEYHFAMADALREEYLAIVNAGFLLQIDDVSLPGRYRLLVDRDGVAAFRRWSAMAIEALNHALRGIPAERVRYHMCWASMNAPHTDDPPLVELLDALLNINAQGYQIEAANVRHEHEYHVWEERGLPDGKLLMPGVICHATNVIEHPAYVAERILRYGKAVGRANVIAATDCGFRWRVHPQIAWAKLEALVAGARLASAQLWPSA